MLHFRVTGVALLLALATGWSWLRPIVITNAIVGAAYMCIEHDALEELGSHGLESYLGFPPVRPGRAENVGVNVLFHVVLTLPLLRYRVGAFVPNANNVCFLACLCVVVLCCLDLPKVYPTAIVPHEVLAAAYVLVLCVVMHRSRRPRLPKWFSDVESGHEE